jgi:hypothetical protein
MIAMRAFEWGPPNLYVTTTRTAINEETHPRPPRLNSDPAVGADVLVWSLVVMWAVTSLWYPFGWDQGIFPGSATRSSAVACRIATRST